MRARFNDKGGVGSGFGIVRLIVIFSLVSFLPLGLLTYASLRLASDAVADDVDARLRSTALVGASAVRHEIEGFKQVVTSYAARPSIREAISGSRPQDDPVLDTALKELRQVRSGIATTFLAEPSGRLIAIEPPTPAIVGEDFSYRDWYKGVTAEGRSYVSEVYRTKAAGRERVVGVAAPIHGPDGSEMIIGIIVAAYSIDDPTTFATVASLGADQDITVVDQRGTVVTDPAGPASRLGAMRNDPRVRASMRGRSGVTKERGPDTDELSAYAPVPNIGWTVIASIDEKTAFAGVARLRSVVLSIAAALALALGGGLVYLSRVFRARSRAERELRASENRFVQLIEALPVGLFVRTSDGRPYLVNEEARRLLGKEVDAVADTDEFATSHQLRRAGTQQPYPAEQMPIFRALRGERSMVDDMEVVLGSSVTPIEVRGAPIYDGDGKLLYAIAAFTDITKRRAAQDEAERARLEAERANHAKSDFLSRMSHELRTPLNAILGFAQLLAMDAESKEEKESLGYILKGGQHLLALINEVLDIARIEAGTLSFSLEAVDVDSTLQEVIDLANPLAAARNIDITVASLGPTGLHVTADRQRLKQVLLNLFSNAIKYNHENGSVDVSVTEAAPDRVRISVADTGPGISLDKLHDVFVPFERLGAEQTEVEGTGIGLALSRALVESMGGTISVESSPGAGSTFWIELSVADSPLEAALPAPLTNRTGERLHASATVLSIEDNPSNIKLLERIFQQRENVRVLTAIQGTVGLELAAQHHPDLILLDLNLPDIQGMEVLKRLRADPATAAIPVVVLSADATPGQITRLLAAGARDYLTKPIDVQMCLDVLDDILGERAET